MTSKDSNIDENIKNSDVSSTIIMLIGIMVFLTILSPALLHTNLEEFIVDRFNVTILDTSLFDSVLYASYLIFGILGAILSNQLGKRREFILIGSMGSAIFYFLMTQATEFNLLLIFRFLQGSFTVLSWQTLMILILDFSSPSNRGKNMGIFGIFLALAMGGGPVLGGLLTELGDLSPYYFASFFSLVVFIVTFIFLKEPINLNSKPTIIENLKIVNRKPELVIPGIFNFIDRFHIGFILFVLQFFLQSVLNVDPQLRGMVLGLFATPFILLQYPIGKWSDRVGRYKPLIFGSISTGIILSLIGFAGNFGLIPVIILFIILGIANGFTGPPSMALVGDIIENSDNATGMGFFNLMGNVGIIIGPLVGGFLITYTNYPITFVIAGLIEIFTLILVLTLKISFFKENKKKD